MKKLLLALLVIAGVSFAGSARGNYSRDVSTLPATAQSFIRDNFRVGISLIKTEMANGSVDEYEVILADGSELTFDRAGNWTDVETNLATGVPASVLPQKVKEYVANYYPDSTVIGIERDRKGYEVDLNGKVELHFDLQGNFLKR